MIQTALLPTAMSSGRPPTLIVVTTRFVLGSIRETVPSALFATQTVPAPTATLAGISPTPIVLMTRPLTGSRRKTELSAPFVSQTAPAPHGKAGRRESELDRH